MPIIIPWETTKATETESKTSKLVTEKKGIKNSKKGGKKNRKTKTKWR